MVDNNKEKQKEHLRLYEHYFVTENVLGKIQEELLEIKRANELEKKHNLANVALRIHSYNRESATAHYNNGKLWELNITSDALNEYDKLIKELKNLEEQAWEKIQNSQKSKCKQCQKEIPNNSGQYEFCSKICYLTSEITKLLAEVHNETTVEKLHQLSHKLLELAQEHVPSLPNNLKPYIDSLIKNLQKLTNEAYETWNSADKLQGVLNYLQAKEKAIGLGALSLLEAGTKYAYPISADCFWSGYDWVKTRVKQRIEELNFQQFAKNTTQSNTQQRESNLNQNLQNLPPCPQCQQKWFTDQNWHQPEAKDNLEFCSSKCCFDYYQTHPFCDNCGRVGTISYPISGLSWLTWKDVDENHKYLHDSKYLVEYLETKLGKFIKKNYSKRHCLPDCLWKDSGISEIVNGWTYEDWENYGKWLNERNNHANVDSEQNRTEQNRTEQNRTEQNRTEQNAGKFSNINQESELINNIQNLKSQISQLESSTNPNQSLLNSKKEELRNLENKLKESNQKTIQEQNNNSKLYWGIGGGIFGVGLVGVLVYLITKNKKEKSNA